MRAGPGAGVGPEGAGAVGVASAGTPPGPQILTTDASRFYALYDSTGGKPSIAQLASYLAEGSPGLGELAKARRVTPEHMAEAIASQPGCMRRDAVALQSCRR